MDYSGTVEPLLRVRQTREFADAPLDAAHLEAIVDAARWSGSRENRQPWRFVVIGRTDTVRAIGKAGAPDARTLATAPAAVAIVLPQDKSAAISNAFDEGRAAERMLVAAELLGLGAGLAWIGADQRPAVGELLGVPEGWFVRTIVAIGSPSDSQGERSRRPREETVFRERWGR
jgi:nitroreductase